MQQPYYVYILASRSRNLYTGVTNNLERRLAEHRFGLLPGFTKRYRIFRLVHYEMFGDIRLAIAREKQIKAWRRERKLWLIQRNNPRWNDLAADWFPKPKGSANKTPDKRTADSSHGQNAAGSE
ncbi:MAG TPA: GIY-YIG nuclease family protein [Candidatus Acidoferrales bacterium]|nr:GIY-YIG nuclease family protein [Candidatus Acidoferrales bacterium]